MTELYEDIMNLSVIPGTSGDESAVRDYIENKLSSIGSVSLSTDRLGNLTALKKGKKSGRDLVFCAHMDESGFIITHIDENGFLRFSTIGDMDPRTVIGKRVSVGENSIPGLIGSKAIHLVSKEDMKKETDIDDLYIDIGADSRDEALKNVHPGDRAVYDSFTERFGKDDRMLTSRALDDRVGCALLIDLLKKDSEYDYAVIFSARQESGGVSAAVNGICPEISVTVDACPANDIPMTEEKDAVCRIGKGAVLAFSDRRTLYDMTLYHRLADICDNNGIKWQTKEGAYGKNDSASIQKSSCGVKIAFAGFPARYCNTAQSAVSLDDIDSLGNLLYILSVELCKE